MARVMAVALCPHGRLHYLDPGGHTPRVGDAVLIPGPRGHEVGTCAWGPTETDWDEAPLPLCGGLASVEDVARAAARRARGGEIRAAAEELIALHGLAMSVISAEAVDGGPGADDVSVVSFRASQPGDYRGLVGDLGRRLRTPVELRQLGVRDTAAAVGGVGPCGRELCCTVRRPAEEPVSARAAREQEHASNVLQVVGCCGRLKCCLAYEQKDYADFAARAPRPGSVVETGSGEGVVSGLAMPIDSVWVRGPDGLRACPVDELRIIHDSRGCGPRPRTPSAPHPPGADAHRKADG